MYVYVAFVISRRDGGQVSGSSIRMARAPCAALRFAFVEALPDAVTLVEHGSSPS